MQGANPCPHTYAAIGCMSRMAAPQEETHERGMFPPPLQSKSERSLLHEREVGRDPDFGASGSFIKPSYQIERGGADIWAE